MTDSLPAHPTGSISLVFPAVEPSPAAHPVPDRVRLIRRMSPKATSRTPFGRALRDTERAFKGLFGEASAALGRTDGSLYWSIEHVCGLHATGERHPEEYARWREREKIRRHGNALNLYQPLFRFFMRDCPREEIKKASKYAKVANAARALRVPVEDTAEWIRRNGGIGVIASKRFSAQSAKVADAEARAKADRERLITEWFAQAPIAVIRADHPKLEGMPDDVLLVARRVGRKLHIIAPLCRADARRAVRREVAQ